MEQEEGNIMAGHETTEKSVRKRAGIEGKNLGLFPSGSSTRQHPVEDKADPKVTFKTLPRATAAVAKPSSRTTATRGE